MTRPTRYIWSDGTDWYSATDLDELRGFVIADRGDGSFDADDWRLLPGTEVLSIEWEDAPPDVDRHESRTAAEWAAFTTGFLCSTER